MFGFARGDIPLNWETMMTRYIQGITKVNLYNAPVLRLQIPSAIPIAKEYMEECIGQMRSIKVNSVYWQETVLPKCMSVPETISNFDIVFTVQCHSIKALLELLKDTPDNESLKWRTVTTIQRLIDEVEKKLALVEDTKDKIIRYKNKCCQSGQYVEQIVSRLSFEEEKDRALYNEITGKINEISAIISEQEKIINEDAFLNASPTADNDNSLKLFGIIFLALAIIGCCFMVLKPQIKKFEAIAIVKEKTKELEALKSRQKDKQRDLDVLSQYHSQMNHIGEKLDELLPYMDDVIAMWRMLAEDFHRVIDALNETEQAVMVNHIEEALADMDKVEENWKCVKRVADFLEGVSYQVQESSAEEIERMNAQVA